MDFIKDALASGNYIIWAIIIVVLVVILRFIKNAGKGLIIFISIIGVVYILSQYFPGIAAPISDFVKGGWMGSNR
jgi:hypothetical protein